MRKVWVSISQVSLTGWFWYIFPSLGKCISHVMKYTLGGISGARKVSILWENYWYQLPRLFQSAAFYCTFLRYGKLMGKPMHFPRDEVYYSMGILLKRTPIPWENYGYQFLRFSSCDGFCCILPCFEKLLGRSMHFSYDEIRFFSSAYFKECSNEILSIIWKTHLWKIRNFWNEITDIFFLFSIVLIFDFCKNMKPRLYILFFGW